MNFFPPLIMKILYYIFKSIVVSGDTTSWATKWCIILILNRQMGQSLQQQRCKHRSTWMLSETSLCGCSGLFSCLTEDSSTVKENSKVNSYYFSFPCAPETTMTFFDKITGSFFLRARLEGWSFLWHSIKFTLRCLGEGVLWKPVKEIARQATSIHAKSFIQSKDHPYQRKESFRVLWAWTE